MGNIVPRMWDNEQFLALPVVARLVWCHLLTCSQDVPGLIRTSARTLADALRLEDHLDVQAALNRLVELGLVEEDQRARLVRVPNAPKYNAPGNANVLRGWFRKWNDMPDSPLKYRHVASIRAAVDRLVEAKGQSHKAHWATEAWGETFGRGADTTNSSSQPSLFSHAGLNRSTNGSTNRSSLDEIRDPRSEIRDPRSEIRDPEARLPFSVSDLLAKLAESGRVAISPFDARMAPPITLVIRQCAEQGVTLDDIANTATWLKAGGLGYREDLGVAWVAKTGELLGAVALARKWIADGNPPLGRGAKPDIRRGRAEPSPASAFKSGVQKL